MVVVVGGALAISPLLETCRSPQTPSKARSCWGDGVGGSDLQTVSCLSQLFLWKWDLERWCTWLNLDEWGGRRGRSYCLSGDRDAVMSPGVKLLGGLSSGPSLFLPRLSHSRNPCSQASRFPLPLYMSRKPEQKSRRSGPHCQLFSAPVFCVKLTSPNLMFTLKIPPLASSVNVLFFKGKNYVLY